MCALCRCVQMSDKKEITRAEQTAAVILDPHFQCARTVSDYLGLETCAGLTTVLRNSTEAIHSGDFSEVESLMFAQGMALNAIFSRLSRLALEGDSMGRFRPEYLELALKAQRQSRATLEALRGYKNAPAVAVQINNSNGAADQKPTNKVLDMDNSFDAP